ncbi:MAG: N-acetylneuraminate synthase [bacterium]|nr:N-acetylneuraminate synthase [bacterium]
MKKIFISIAGRKIAYETKVFIIAEAGVNHNGSLKTALKLVDAAAAASADAIKFQTFHAHEVVTGAGKMAAYQRKNNGKTESQLVMLQRLELPEKFYQPIIQRCRKRKLIFLSTPHGGFSSVDWLQSLDVPAFKFGSGELTNLPLLQYAAKFKKPMILGTGMATLGEVAEAIKAIKLVGNKDIIILHATTNYPCPFNEVNLRAMQTMMQEFNILVGYSDHTPGDQVPVMAVALGACVIEKHFTLNKNMPGPDHKTSLEPKELKEMIDKIRRSEIILGSVQKKPNSSEMSIIRTVRKSLVALSDIKKGEKFSKENLGIKRPGTGLEPKLFFKVLGKKAKRNIQADLLITRADYV